MKELSPGLAAAADVLSDQLHAHLQRLASLLAPHAASLDRRFLAHLQKRGVEPKIRVALNALTPGSAARILAAGKPVLTFIEQVEYYGRRLAKLNLSPASVAEALHQYDHLLAPILKKLKQSELLNFQWVREQLQFCVILTLNNAYYQVRETETRAFYELFRVELEARNLDGLLQQFLQTLMQVCRADAGHLYMLNDARTAWVLKAKADLGAPSRLALNVIANRPSMGQALAGPKQIEIGSGKNSKKQIALLDPSWRNRFRSCWSVPLAAGGRTAGVMQFGFSKLYEWLPREQELLAAAAERCLVAAEKARLLEDLAASEEQIRKLAEHMLHVEEMERRRISRELHDEAGQSLLCIRLQLEMIEQAMPGDRPELIGRLREAREMTEHTILEMRRLIAALSPAVLEQLGLGAALRQLVNRFRRVHPMMRVRLNLGRLGQLPQQTEVILYRLVQECGNNIGKHSAATSVNISVSSTDGRVRLAVEDNGVGFQVEEALARRDSFGISGMRERVALLGGQFEVVSFPVGTRSKSQRGRGTRISISLPIAKDAGIRPEKTIRSRQTRAAIVRAAKNLRASAG